MEEKILKISDVIRLLNNISDKNITIDELIDLVSNTAKIEEINNEVIGQAVVSLEKNFSFDRPIKESKDIVVYDTFNDIVITGANLSEFCDKLKESVGVLTDMGYEPKNINIHIKYDIGVASLVASGYKYVDLYDYYTYVALELKNNKRYYNFVANKFDLDQENIGIVFAVYLTRWLKKVKNCETN